MFRPDFRMPGSQTHEYAQKIVAFAETHHQPLSKEQFLLVLPSVQGLRQELSQAQVDTIIHPENQPADYEIAAQNAVAHAVQARANGETSELHLHQFALGHRATRAHAADLPYDPVSMSYLEQHGLGPAAEAFSQKPIEALERIEERLGPKPSQEDTERLLKSHRAMISAGKEEASHRREYSDFSREVMTQRKQEQEQEHSAPKSMIEQLKARSAAKEVGGQANVVLQQEYQREIAPSNQIFMQKRNRFQALERGHEALVRHLGPARSEDIIAGSPVAAVRKILIALTTTRYQVLRPRAFSAFIDTMEDAIVTANMAWEAKKKASLLKDGISQEVVNEMMSRHITSREQGIANLQITDSIRDNIQPFHKAVAEELGTTREETMKAIQLHSERCEAALEAAASNITKAVDTAGTSIAGAVKGMGQKFDAFEAVAIDEARKHADLTQKVYDTVKKKGDKKKGGIISQTVNYVEDNKGKVTFKILRKVAGAVVKGAVASNL